MNYFWVFIGGGMGSLLRYAISLFVKRWGVGSFPTATLISNLLATTILGILMYVLMPKWSGQTLIYPLIAVGFCGGFSTFSTFSSETLDLLQTGHFCLAALNIFLSILCGLGILYFVQRTV
jgi:CrcB protein